MAGESKAVPIAALISEHYQLVYRYAYRLSGQQADAEDLTQQTFLTAQRRWSQLRDVGAARSWLCTIVRNLYLQSRRKRGQVVPLSDLVTEAVAVVESPPNEIESADLQRVLNGLPEEFRSPLILFYLEEMTYKDIAATLRVPPGTVMSRLSRGKALLRQRLTHLQAQQENLPLAGLSALPPREHK